MSPANCCWFETGRWFPTYQQAAMAARLWTLRHHINQELWSCRTETGESTGAADSRHSTRKPSGPWSGRPHWTATQGQWGNPALSLPSPPSVSVRRVGGRLALYWTWDSNYWEWRMWIHLGALCCEVAGEEGRLGVFCLRLWTNPQRAEVWL